MQYEIETYLTGSSVLDSTLRAHISSLVSAIGGSANGEYALGDEALACLRDVKQWLRGYDERLRRLDVARCLAEADIISNDLIEILLLWKDEDTADKVKSRIALACVEILAPLLWPIVLNRDTSTNNQARHAPYLTNYQAQAKKALLGHPGVLRAIVRTALPSIALSEKDRTPRDEGIINLVLYVFRNLAAIGCCDSVSKSKTFLAFEQEQVLDLLLTIAGNVFEGFSTQDTVVIDLLYHLLCGIDVHAILSENVGPELENLLECERLQNSINSRKAVTRHNRFGTMISVVAADVRLTVPSQKALLSKEYSLQKIDSSKKWNKSRPRHPDVDVIKLVRLTPEATKVLRKFLARMMESSFNRKILKNIHSRSSICSLAQDY